MSNNNWFNWLNGDENKTEVKSSLLDSQGNVYLCGTSDSKIIRIMDKTYSRMNDTNTGFIMKMTSNGQPVWFSWIDGSKEDIAFSIAIDKDDNICLVGYSKSTSIVIKNIPYNKPATDVDEAVFVIKFKNTNGDVMWFNWIGGSKSEEGFVISCDSNKNIIVAGESSSNKLIINDATGVVPTADLPEQVARAPATFDETSIFVVQFDTDGNLMWSRWLRGTKTEEVYSMCVDNNDTIYISGNTVSLDLQFIDNTGVTNTLTRVSNNDIDAFVIRIDTSGAYDNWFNWINGSGQDYINNMTLDVNNNLYITGTSSSEIITIDSKGYSRNSTEDTNMTFIVKINTSGPSGSVDWFKWIETDKDQSENSVMIDKTNNVYLTGNTAASYVIYEDIQYSNDSVDFNTSYIIKLKPDSTFEWIRWITTSDEYDPDGDIPEPTITVYSILNDKNNNIYIGGYSNTKTVTFNDEIISSRNNNSEMGYMLRYNIEEINNLESLKSCKVMIDSSIAKYKYMLYFSIFVIFCLVIYILYINKLL